jgi:hypothetical protein
LSQNTAFLLGGTPAAIAKPVALLFLLFQLSTLKPDSWLGFSIVIINPINHERKM